MVYGALWYGRNGTFQSAHHNRRRRRKKGHQMQEITTEQPSFPFYRYCECGIGHISIGVHWWLLCACLSVSLNFMFWLFCSAQNRFAACVAIMINSQIHTLRFYSIACSLVKRQFFFRWSNGERARTQSSFIHSFFIFWKMKKHTNTLWNMASKWTWTNYLRGTNEQIRDFSIWNKSSHALTEPNHKQYAHSIRENMKRFRRNNRCCSFFSRPSGRSSVFHRVVAPIYKFFNKMHI